MTSDYREQARVIAIAWAIGGDASELAESIAAALVAAHKAGMEAGAVIAETQWVKTSVGKVSIENQAEYERITIVNAIRTAAAKGETDDS